MIGEDYTKFSINMTLEEALEELSDAFQAEMAHSDLLHYREEVERRLEALAIGTDAIAKQIPKKPIIITDICEELPFVLLCPNCNAELEAYEHHCTCGQALDWSDD